MLPARRFSTIAPARSTSDCATVMCLLHKSRKVFAGWDISFRSSKLPRNRLLHGSEMARKRPVLEDIIFDREIRERIYSKAAFKEVGPARYILFRKSLK